MNIYLSIGGLNFIVKYSSKDARFFQPLITDINSIYKNFKRSYIVKSKVNFVITIRHLNTISLDIKQEGYSSIILYRKLTENNYETYSYISFVQLTTIILRAIRSQLNNKSGFILHASANLINNRAVLFLGKSGAGKTTIASLLNDKYPRIADDNIIIRNLNGQYCIFQSPLLQKLVIDKFKKPIPISKIFFIKKSKKCSSKLITDKSIIFKKLIEDLWVEKDTLSLGAEAVQKFSTQFNAFYTMRFPKNKLQIQEFISHQ